MALTKRCILIGCAAVSLALLFWALRVELTYARNMHHGIPADFHLRLPHRVAMWRA